MTAARLMLVPTARPEVPPDFDVEAQRVALAGVLAGGLVHDVSNPLAYILANVAYATEELARMAKQPDPMARIKDLSAALDDVRVGAERVQAMMSDVRRLARGGVEAPRFVDLRKTLDAALRLAGSTLGTRVKLEREDVEVPLVRVDESRLIQLIVAMLLDAAPRAKAAIDGRRPTVTIRLFCTEDVAGFEIGSPDHGARETLFDFESETGGSLASQLGARIEHAPAGEGRHVRRVTLDVA